jgi:hypothetical protein
VGKFRISNSEFRIFKTKDRTWIRDFTDNADGIYAMNKAFTLLTLVIALCMPLLAVTNPPGGVASGLKVWFDADDAASITKNSANKISQWNDKSGNNFHVAIPSGGTDDVKPCYEGGALNNKAVVRFDGCNDALLNNAITTSGSLTTFVVFKNRRSALLCDYADVLCATSLYDSPGFMLESSNTWQNPQKGYFVEGTTNAITKSNYINGAGSANPQAINLQQWYIAATTMSNVGASGTLRIGCAPTPKFYGCNDIAEIIIYSRALTQDERFSVEDYLAAKWDLTASHNLAVGKTAVASSGGGDYTAGNAVDNNLGTRWGSTYCDNQWIYVDLGGNIPVNRVALLWEAAYASSYKIQTMADGKNPATDPWTTAYSNNSGDGNTDDIVFPTVTARYVRMYGIQRATSYGFSLWEFKIFSQDIGNLAYLRPASSSSVEAQLWPSQAVDGNHSTRWGSGWSDNQWLKIDLQGLWTINKVVLNWETSCAATYSIEVSNTGDNWTIVSVQTSGLPGAKEIAFTPVVGRYVRIYCIDRVTPYGFSLWECKVYGTAGPNVAPTDIAINNTTIFANDPAATVVGTLSAIDPNLGDSLTYSLVSGEGATDNSAFTISANQLKTLSAITKPAGSIYTVRIRATETGSASLFFEKPIVLSVNGAGDLSYTLDKFALFATSCITLNTNSEVTSGSIGCRGAVTGCSGSSVNHSMIAQGAVALNNTAVLGDLYAGGTITRTYGASVAGNMRQSMTVQLPTLTTKCVVPGACDKPVCANATLDLAPGSYKDVTLGANATLILHSGVYNLCKLTTCSGSKIRISLTNNEPIELNILTQLFFNDCAKIILNADVDPALVRIYSNQTCALEIRPQDDIAATITVPNGEVQVHPNSKFTGRILAKSVVLFSGAHFNESSNADSDGDGVQDII